MTLCTQAPAPHPVLHRTVAMPAVMHPGLRSVAAAGPALLCPGQPLLEHSFPGPSISRGKSASPFLPISDDDRALAFILNSLALSLSVPLKPDFVYVPVHGSLYKIMLCVSSRRSKRSLFPVFQYSLFFTLSLKSYTICLK